MSLFQSIIITLQKGFEQESQKHQRLADAISEILGTTITPGQITVKRGVLRVAAPATVKMEMNMKKELLLARCREVERSVGSVI